jgi:hypothetical protein
MGLLAKERCMFTMRRSAFGIDVEWLIPNEERVNSGLRTVEAVVRSVRGMRSAFRGRGSNF